MKLDFNQRKFIIGAMTQAFLVLGAIYLKGTYSEFAQFTWMNATMILAAHVTDKKLNPVDKGELFKQ